MNIYDEFNQEALLDSHGRSRFAKLLNVSQDLFDRAFHKNGHALTKAYYDHQGHVYHRLEMSNMFNKAGLSCLTGITIPVAVPIMMAALYMRWNAGKALVRQKTSLRTSILALTD